MHPRISAFLLAAAAALCAPQAPAQSVSFFANAFGYGETEDIASYWARRLAIEECRRRGGEPSGHAVAALYQVFDDTQAGKRITYQYLGSVVCKPSTNPQG